ncbi:glycosyl transferase [Halovulum dunhuangense]|uniref:Glycosyl transferase n=1 Tax=Halovulum dunhuangense TaxID=1505036 RepID=A0A849KPS8_9RHOB|nr:glycosyltransferase [Halovulum dunhuangense]NNU79063.1 glycosyl transferase [Halovulum dunhuangense]
MRVVLLAHDLGEPAEIRWIRALRGAGMEVEVIGFRKPEGGCPAVPEWSETTLGPVGHGVGMGRVLALLGAFPRLWAARGTMRRAEVIVARNLDMALLALVARVMAGRAVPLVYQCLDIHGLMLARGAKGRLARWAERRVLARCMRLLVSAPRFLSGYFEPMQGYRGRAMLVENRIHWPAGPPARPEPRASVADPLRLGWVGTLRCPESLRLLTALADLMGPRVRIVMRGIVHRHQLPDFDTVLAGRPNVTFEGGYAYPHGLAEAYAALDCVWAQDMWQRGGNSDWLWPNRIYEAGFFGCPCLALADTATGQRIVAEGAGIVFDAPDPVAIAAALLEAGPSLAAISAGLLARPVSDFALQDAEVRASVALSDPRPAVRSRAGLRTRRGAG